MPPAPAGASHCKSENRLSGSVCRHVTRNPRRSKLSDPRPTATMLPGLRCDLPSSPLKPQSPQRTGEARSRLLIRPLELRQARHQELRVVERAERALEARAPEEPHCGASLIRRRRMSLWPLFQSQRSWLQSADDDTWGDSDLLRKSAHVGIGTKMLQSGFELPWNQLRARNRTVSPTRGCRDPLERPGRRGRVVGHATGDRRGSGSKGPVPCATVVQVGDWPWSHPTHGSRGRAHTAL
jgi:hypothetical protein